jgi:hypothetical protein
MHMIAASSLRNSKQDFECLRCGSLDTIRCQGRGMPFGEKLSACPDLEAAKRFRYKAAEALQLAELAETKSRRETLVQIAAQYIRTAEQLEGTSQPNAKVR